MTIRRRALAGLVLGSLVVLFAHHWQYVLLHMTGIDTQASWYYDFWSGIGPSLLGAGGLLLAWFGFRLELKLLRAEQDRMRRELQEHRAAREDDYDISEGLA